MSGPKLTDDEMHELIEKDPTAALCRLIEEAGLTMTLYGVPVTEEQLRGHAEAIVDDKIEKAALSILTKDANLTDRQKLSFLIDRIDIVVRSVTGIINPVVGELDGNGRIVATRQLEQLLKLAKEL